MSGSQWLSSASPSLATLIKQAATEVPHPFIPGKTLWDARTDVGPYTPANFSSAFGNILPEVDAEFMDRYKKEKLERDEATIGVWPLGSGSDFTIFLQHLGVCHLCEINFNATLIVTVFIRLPAQMKHLHELLSMQFITIILFMILISGWNVIQMPVSFATYESFTFLLTKHLKFNRLLLQNIWDSCFTDWLILSFFRSTLPFTLKNLNIIWKSKNFFLYLKIIMLIRSSEWKSYFLIVINFLDTVLISPH